MNRIFLKVDLLDWVYGTIKKVQNGRNWNAAWLSTYHEIGGKKCSIGTKPCPKHAARILYQTGRLKCSGIRPKKYCLTDVWKDSRNGVYALVAADILLNSHSVDYDQLKICVYKTTQRCFNSSPVSDQGAIKLTYMLWKLEKIRC